MHNQCIADSMHFRRDASNSQSALQKGLAHDSEVGMTHDQELETGQTTRLAMKLRSTKTIVVTGLTCGVMLFSGTIKSHAISLGGVQGVGVISQFTDDATYGTPTAFYAPDGPITFDSGDPIALLRGPNNDNANGVPPITGFFLVLSAKASDVASLAGPITVGWGGGSATINSSDFFSHSAGGFPIPPDQIGGIGSGQINGIVFPESMHAAVRFNVTTGDLGQATGYDFGDITITSGIGLRGDFFGFYASNGTKRIVNNSPNSHGFGVPEPSSAVAGLIALAGLGFLARRRR